MQGIFGVPIPYFVLILEVVVLLALLVGWRYGASRMNFRLHHQAVYGVVLIHILTVGFWMIPRARERLSIMLANPITFWYQIVHDIIGILAIVLGAVLALIFLVKRGMPLKLLKRTRFFMFLTIGVWIIAFLLGVYWFVLAWV
jgi:hypothetical protein